MALLCAVLHLIWCKDPLLININPSYFFSSIYINIFSSLFALGNDVINDIYEANFKDKGDENEEEIQEMQIRRATSDCEINVREKWIKMKYIDTAFVIPHTNCSLAQEKHFTLRDIVFRDDVWFVRPRRGKRIKLRIEKADNVSSSELSIDSRTIKEPDFGAERYSSDDDEDYLPNKPLEEKLEYFNSNMLLYASALVHNLPVMCYALAIGASKCWSNSMDSNRSQLHQAVQSNSIAASVFLILNGFHINAVDIYGHTPLHLGTQRGYTTQAYLLLKHQAKHDVTSKDGKKPIDIAVDQANADIVTLLRLTRLNEEIRMEEHGNREIDTYNDVMNDFSRFAVSQPQKLQRQSK